MTREAQERSNSLLREMEELTRAGGWEYDVARAQVTWTDGVYRIYGVERTHDPGDLAASVSFYAPEARSAILDAFGRAAASGEPYDLELPFIRADGKRIWVRTSGRPEVQDGRVVRVVGNIVDVTERRTAESLLAEQELRFRVSIDALPDALAICSAVRDPAGRIVDFRVDYANAAACANNGMTADEPIGNLLCELLPPHRESGLFERYCRVAETGEPLSMEAVTYEDGCAGRRLARVFDVRAVRLVDGFVATWRDVTDRVRAEQDIRNSQKALRNLAARLQAVREEERVSLSRELHDNLGQLLTALKLDIAWLEKRVSRGDCHELPEKLRDMGAVTDDAVRSVHTLAAGLRPAILGPGGLWTSVEAEAVHFTSRSGIPCSLSPGECVACRAGNDPFVAASIVRIVQEALTNVARHAGARNVVISCRPGPTCHELSIADDGRGTAPETSADPRSLGIVGMRERALSFGGELIVESAPGRGTTVTVRIPLTAPAEGA
ncbi:MAG: PAS domain S-box protein [Deltaproteobacteria bacterium]|nr:PAS domain S-box protein [Deltaproteobacteria bacterium]